MATSDDVQGLVAQGRTVTEAVEIARDVARRLFEAQEERGGRLTLPEGTLCGIFEAGGNNTRKFH